MSRVGGERASDFFRSASDDIGLSSERSVTSRFNRLYSFSSCRSRRNSLILRWASFVFQA